MIPKYGLDGLPNVHFDTATFPAPGLAQPHPVLAWGILTASSLGRLLPASKLPSMSNGVFSIDWPLIVLHRSELSLYFLC